MSDDIRKTLATLIAAAQNPPKPSSDCTQQFYGRICGGHIEWDRGDGVWRGDCYGRCGGYLVVGDEEVAADAILARFLVVPRDQVTTEYGMVRPGFGEGFVLPLSPEEVKLAMRPGYDTGVEFMQRNVTSWTAIPLPEDGGSP